VNINYNCANIICWDTRHSIIIQYSSRHKKRIPIRANCYGNYINYSLCIVYNASNHYHWCRNLPFGGRATRGSRVCIPRKENTRSCHQRLFEKNVGKTGKVWSTNLKCERFKSCFYAWGRY